MTIETTATFSASYNGQALEPISFNVEELRERGVLTLAHELPENEFQRFLDIWEKTLEIDHYVFPDTRQNPRYQSFGAVEVDGVTIARFNNQGQLSASPREKNQINLALRIAGKELPDGPNVGPELARERAEIIASALGGDIVFASTALSQSEFDNTPVPRLTVDRAAVEADPRYENLQNIKTARTLHLAQLEASNQIDPSLNPNPDGPSSEPG